MKYFKQILMYAKPYKGYGVLNIISNVFYALFGTLAFVSLMPMLKVLFKSSAPVNTAAGLFRNLTTWRLYRKLHQLFYNTKSK